MSQTHPFSAYHSYRVYLVFPSIKNMLESKLWPSIWPSFLWDEQKIAERLIQIRHLQKGMLDVTAWIEWFLRCLERAIQEAFDVLEKVLDKARFWEKIANITLNERQRKVLNRLLDGFEGKLTSSKWAKMAKCSQDTAHRDIIDLIEKGILIQSVERGRSSSYSLAKGDDLIY